MALVMLWSSRELLRGEYLALCKTRDLMRGRYASCPGGEELAAEADQDARWLAARFLEQYGSAVDDPHASALEPADPAAIEVATTEREATAETHAPGSLDHDHTAEWQTAAEERDRGRSLRLQKLRQRLQNAQAAELDQHIAVLARERAERLAAAARQAREKALVVQTLSSSQLAVLDRCPRCRRPVTGPDEPVDEQGRHWHRDCHDKLGDF